MEAGRKTNAIKVNQQPELIEIKDLKRGHREGGSTAAFTDAQAEWENSASLIFFFLMAAAKNMKPLNAFHQSDSEGPTGSGRFRDTRQMYKITPAWYQMSSLTNT